MKSLLLCIITIFVSSLLTVCDVQNTDLQKEPTADATKLPKEMPADVKMSFGSNGGMSPYYTSIEIEGDTLTYKARTSANKGQEVVWTAKLSPAEKSDLYAVFVENKFDQIKNEKNETITYDAGSEGISISFAPNFSYNAQSGANFPLSPTNKLRYQTVADEFGKLAKKYEPKRNAKIAAAFYKIQKKAHGLI